MFFEGNDSEIVNNAFLLVLRSFFGHTTGRGAGRSSGGRR